MPAAASGQKAAGRDSQGIPGKNIRMQLNERKWYILAAVKLRIAMTDRSLDKRIRALMKDERLPPGFHATVNQIYVPMAGRIAARRNIAGRCLIVGVCGPQGSGKTTMSLFLKTLLEERNFRVASMSIDDLYLTRAEREKLARTVHPLFLTRGVPGTHDVELGLRVLDGLSRAAPGQETRVPRFDKAVDDRAPDTHWEIFAGPADVILFEGWCVGALPESEGSLLSPLNRLERERDTDGRWRRFSNDALAGSYRRLFGLIGYLILLQPPSFDCVWRWRALQEEKLRQRNPGGSRVMSEEELERFIMHFERLTRHILAEMPSRADLVVEIDATQRPVSLRDHPV
jgi:D-glycerate 3-kinase